MVLNNDEIPALSDEVVIDLLSNRRRRYLLYTLFRYSNPVPVNEIVECVTKWELPTSVENIPHERLYVRMSLYHDHIPKCAAKGVLTYDRFEDVVELTAVAADLESHLKRACEDDLASSEREWDWEY